MAVDLHLHSTYSDGVLTPTQLVRKAKQVGLKAIALTDHDSCLGIPEAVRAGKKYRIAVIPGVELSTIYRGHILHILGYFINPAAPALLRNFERLRKERIRRAYAILRRVNKKARAQGLLPVSIKEFVRAVRKKDTIMRGDISNFLLNKGFGKSHHQVFTKWLEDTNVPVRGLSAREAIQLIHRVGGVAVLAHPHHSSLSINAFARAETDQREVLRNLKRMGLDGLEVYTKYMGRAITNRYIMLGKALGYIFTGGSDYHGPHIPDMVPLGSTKVPDLALARLKELQQRYVKFVNS